jgi:hypothetical protein
MAADGAADEDSVRQRHRTSTEVIDTAMRSLARSRAFPVLAWAYLVALAVQVLFAGMYVFVGASNIELHRNMAHVIGLLTIGLIAAVFIGRVDRRDRMLTLGVLGLLIVQGMLVHVGQWFGLWTIAALHPVNALVLTYASLELAKRSNRYWAAADAPAERTAFEGMPAST